jgi:DNA polymerase-3 subunit beta
VLRGLLLAAEGEALVVTGYDQSLAIRREVGAQVAAAGRCVAPGEMLGKLVGALPTGSMVQLEDTGTGQLAITAGEGRYSLALPDEPDDYPRLPEFDPEADPVILSYGVFQKALQAVSYAAATEVSKGALCGVNFSDLRATASDGSRVCAFTLEAPEACKLSFTVATDAVKELEKLGLAENDLVFLTQTKSHALFRTGKVSIIASLFAGAYPNVASLIPKACENTIILNRQEFIESIERSMVISDAAAAIIKYITIAYTKKTCELSITTANDAGSATDKIAAQKGVSENFAVKMNPKYLLDALRHCEGNFVLLSHHVDSRGGNQFLIHSEEGNHKQLIMGMGDPAPRK